MSIRFKLATKRGALGPSEVIEFSDGAWVEEIEAAARLWARDRDNQAWDYVVWEYKYNGNRIPLR